MSLSSLGVEGWGAGRGICGVKGIGELWNDGKILVLGSGGGYTTVKCVKCQTVHQMQVRQLQIPANQIRTKGWDNKTQVLQVLRSQLRPCLSTKDPRFPHPYPPGTKMHSCFWKYLLQPPRLQNFPKGLNGFFDGPRGAGVSLQEQSQPLGRDTHLKEPPKMSPVLTTATSQSEPHGPEEWSLTQGKWTRPL